jgi:hypothetical protein
VAPEQMSLLARRMHRAVEPGVFPMQQVGALTTAFRVAE